MPARGTLGDRLHRQLCLGVTAPSGEKRQSHDRGVSDELRSADALPRGLVVQQLPEIFAETDGCCAHWHDPKNNRYRSRGQLAVRAGEFRYSIANPLSLLRRCVLLNERREGPCHKPSPWITASPMLATTSRRASTRSVPPPRATSPVVNDTTSVAIPLAISRLAC